MSTKRQSLGKGLDALLGMAEESAFDGLGSSDLQSKEGQLREMAVEFLQRGKYQPRRDINAEALEELASSIRAQGVMQPLVVRGIGEDKYEIIAGERRWRAAQQAGLDVVPVIVRDVSDEAAIAMALIENIQRENLNAIEEAEALKRLQVEFELSQQQVAERVGKSRSVIANLLRLLTLEPDVRHLIETSQLDTGHAKVLLALEGPKQLKVARQVVSGKLSVRQTESLVKSTLAGPNSGDEASTRADPNITKLERDLSGKLGAAVSINHAKAGRGKLVINYSSLDELDGILRRIR